MPHEFLTIQSSAETLGPAVERQFVTFCRGLLQHPSLVKEPGYLRYITNEPHPFGNVAILSGSDDPLAATGSIGPLAEGAFPAAVILPGRATPEVDAVLTGRGFGVAETMPAMAVEFDALAPTALPEGYTFNETSDPAEFDAWCEAFAVGYELPRQVADVFGPAGAAQLPPDTPVQYYAVRRGGRMVCTSICYLDGELAGIYGVSTIPDERGKGLGAHATAEPLRRAREIGYRTGVLQSSAMGESVYRRLGFRAFGGLPVYVRLPGG